MFVVCLVAVLVLIGIVGFYQKSSVNRLTGEIAALNAEKQRYNQILAQIKKFEEDKKLIENKIAVIKELKKSSALTVRILDEVANLTPTKRLWLDSINQSGPSLKIQGTALDNQTIAAYMDELTTSPYIQSVTLLNTAQKGYADRDLKSFQLTCSITIPDSPEQETTAETNQQ